MKEKYSVFKREGETDKREEKMKKVWEMDKERKIKDRKK